jgi:predicted amidohydrolase YtcJ
MSPAFLFRHPLTKMTNFMDWNFIKMIKHSAHITIGSDWIGNAPASLLEHCGNVIDDIDQATGGKGGEALCKMLTLNGAQAVGREKDLGSIEVGKKASFIAVSRDLSAGEFRDAKVLKTWFEGELIWAEQ